MRIIKDLINAIMKVWFAVRLSILSEEPSTVRLQENIQSISLDRCQSDKVSLIFAEFAVSTPKHKGRGRRKPLFEHPQGPGGRGTKSEFYYVPASGELKNSGGKRCAI